MYIDLFIIQNLIYDYLILNGVAILTDEKMRLSRLSLGLISSLVLSTLLFMMDFTTLVGLVPFVMLDSILYLHYMVSFLLVQSVV